MDIKQTAAALKERAYQARVSINVVLKRAGVSSATFWRWERDMTATAHPVTIAKIEDALDQIERERAA